MSSTFHNLLKTIKELTPKECEITFRQNSKKLSSIRRNLKIELITSITSEKRQILLKECKEYTTLITNQDIWIKLIRHRFGVPDPISAFGLAGAESYAFDVYMSILEADTLYEEGSEQLYSILINNRNLIGLRYIVELYGDLDNDHFPEVVDMAVAAGDIPGVVMLLDSRQSKDIHITSQSLITALELNQYTIARLLIERGVDIDVYNDEGMSPILISSNSSDPEVVSIIERLIDLNADVDDYDALSRTPIMLAAEVGNSLVIELLLKEGADAEMTDNSGKNAWYYASDNGHSNVLKLLE